jgi:ribonuclease PH
MAVDLPLLGERQLIVDCDVLQADGGTRTAAVTGGWVAVALALQSRIAAGALPPAVLRRQIAAISAGMVGGEPLLDLAYQEDVAAESDVNIVMTAEGELIEIQGTAEKEPFSRADLDRLLELARNGIQQLAELQRMAVQGAG